MCADPSQYYRVSDLAHRWAVHRSTVYKWIDAGVLRACRFPGTESRQIYRISSAEVLRFEAHEPYVPQPH